MTRQPTTTSEATPSAAERLEAAARRVGNVSGFMMSAEIDAGSETSSARVQTVTSPLSILPIEARQDSGTESVGAEAADDNAALEQCEPDSLSAALMMDIRMVEAAKSLPLPKSFQRFVNFDRPLEEDLC